MVICQFPWIRCKCGKKIFFFFIRLLYLKLQMLSFDRGLMEKSLIFHSSKIYTLLPERNQTHCIGFKFIIKIWRNRFKNILETFFIMWIKRDLHNITEKKFFLKKSYFSTLLYFWLIKSLFFKSLKFIF